MTAYHGGKQRIGKKLAEIIVDEALAIAEEKDFKIKGYCEPFCGMLGVYRHIPELFEEEGLGKGENLTYKAGDINKSVVMMWQASQKGWKPPPHITEAQYNKLKSSSDSALRGYAGHQYSFGGQNFKGYAPKYGKVLKSSATVVNKIQQIGKDMKNVQFISKPYTYFSNLKGYVIYCDPPYENTIQRYEKDKKDKKDNIVGFDSKEFHKWCNHMSKENIVFLSEYKAPEDFTKIYSSTSKLTGMSSCKTRERTENLYVL